LTSAVLNELAADAYVAADLAEPFVHPNVNLCENGLTDTLRIVWATVTVLLMMLAIRSGSIWKA